MMAEQIRSPIFVIQMLLCLSAFGQDVPSLIDSFRQRGIVIMDTPAIKGSLSEFDAIQCVENARRAIGISQKYKQESSKFPNIESAVPEKPILIYNFGWNAPRAPEMDYLLSYYIYLSHPTYGITAAYWVHPSAKGLIYTTFEIINHDYEGQLSFRFLVREEDIYSIVNELHLGKLLRKPISVYLLIPGITGSIQNEWWWYFIVEQNGENVEYLLEPHLGSYIADKETFSRKSIAEIAREVIRDRMSKWQSTEIDLPREVSKETYTDLIKTDSGMSRMLSYNPQSGGYQPSKGLSVNDRIRIKSYLSSRQVADPLRLYFGVHSAVDIYWKQSFLLTPMEALNLYERIDRKKADPKYDWYFSKPIQLLFPEDISP
jgi:hypothetical protein